MITIDEVRKQANEYDPWFHGGQGCIKLGLKSGLRYHFYNELCPPCTPDARLVIHDHLKDLGSEILKGAARNILYCLGDKDSESELELLESSCKAGEDPVFLEANVTLIRTATFVSSVGDNYWLDYRQLHDVEIMTPKVITHITLSKRKQQKAHFVKDRNKAWVCGLTAAPRTVDQCWELIEDTLL